MPKTGLLLAIALAIGCSDDPTSIDADAAPGADARPDAREADAMDPDAGVDPFDPQRLQDTGLYSDFANLVIADGIFEYEPQFELWSDGALKRRWVQLPPGSQIDTSDMDFWVYPEGTKMWKEFVRDGLRVETRMYWKQGPSRDDWVPFTFAWNMAQDEAPAAPNGAQNVLGTNHDIPSVFVCGNCHAPQPDFVLGYSAIQLDGNRTGQNLSDLVADGSLTDNPPGAGPTYFPIPGGATHANALGYLHGNCGGCHYPDSSVADIVPVDLRLEVDRLQTVNQTGTFRTAVAVPPTLAIAGATSIIEPGDPASSALRIRMNSLANIRMPPLASEEVDTDAVSMIDTWIGVVPPPP